MKDAAPRAVAVFAALGLAHSNAWALDCVKAASGVETAICAEPELMAADQAMSEAYGEVRAASSGAEKKMLALSQRRWLKAREDQCGQASGLEIKTCILDRMRSRRNLLAGAPESGPGTGARMMPVFIQQHGARKLYDVDVVLVRFAAPQTPAERLFNLQVDKIANEAPLGPIGQDAPEGMMLSSTAGMAIAYAAPDLISAQVDRWSFDGGAHGNGGTANINVDLKRAKLMQAEDLFDAAAQAKLEKDCEAQIARQKTEKMEGETFNPANDPNYQESTIAKHLADLTRWTFRADKATVTFDPYAIGSYAEGPYDCTFTMVRLRYLAKPSATLPSTPQPEAIP